MQEAKPIVGQYWQGHGGIYAGLIREGDQQFHLIMATGEQAAAKLPWGKFGEEIEGEFSFVNGQHNTQLILAADPENAAAKFVTTINIEGHTDFYWPAQKEQNLLYINLQDQCDAVWHWSSTQYSAHDAWFTDFEDGYQDLSYKDYSYAVRAVRRELAI